ncbi:glycosyltransferase family 39 protein [Elusimicrobiota bacterium]
MARNFSADHQLGAFVVLRLQALRILAVAAGAVLLTWGALPGEKRTRALSALARWAEHPGFVLLVFAVAAAFAWTEMYIPESEPTSEGIMAYGSWRVARGAVPCRDFVTYAFPGGYYFLGLFYRLFGPSMELGRVLTVVVPKLLIMLVFYLLAAPLLRRPAALAVAAFALLVMSPNPDTAQIYAGSLAILLAFATLPLIARFLRDRDRRMLAFAGVSAGLCATIRQDFGLYTLISNTLFLGIALWAERRGPAPIHSRLSCLAYYLLPWACVTGVVGTAMLVTIPFEQLTECYLRGATSYMQVAAKSGESFIPFMQLLSRRSALSGSEVLSWLLVHEAALLLTWIAIGIGAWRTLLAWRRAELDPERLTMAMLVIWAAVYMAHAFKGSSIPLVGAAPTGMMILALLLKEARARLPGKWAPTVLCFGLLCLAGHGGVRLFFRPFNPPPASVWITTEVGRYLCPDRKAARTLRDAIAHVRDILPPDRRLLVYDQTRDGNNVLFHFLSERDSCTRYHEISVGFRTDPGIYDRVIADLERDGTAIILETEYDGSIATNGPLNALDEHILRNYAPDARFGSYIFWKRKP